MAEKKRLAPVISGGARVKKKSDFEKAAGGIVGDIFKDILVPAAKKFALDALQYVFYPNGGYSGNRSNGARAERYSYNSRYNSSYDRDRRDNPARIGLNYQDLDYSDAGEAQLVLDSMVDALYDYNEVSVADLYDLSGVQLEEVPSTANEWGWKNLSDAKIIRNYDGRYQIKLPRAVSLR